MNAHNEVVSIITEYQEARYNRAEVEKVVNKVLYSSDPVLPFRVMDALLPEDRIVFIQVAEKIEQRNLEDLMCRAYPDMQ